MKYNDSQISIKCLKFTYSLPNFDMFDHSWFARLCKIPYVRYCSSWSRRDCRGCGSCDCCLLLLLQLLLLLIVAVVFVTLVVQYKWRDLYWAEMEKHFDVHSQLVSTYVCTYIDSISYVCIYILHIDIYIYILHIYVYIYT